MFKILRIENGGVVLAVIGQLRAGDVSELSALLADEPAGQTLVLDLKNLVLADRPAVRFLHECEHRGIELRNCPGYVRIWIGKGFDLE
jgi:hypothetical protein